MLLLLNSFSDFEYILSPVRLQLELQKSASVSPSPSKQGGATTPAKQATQPKSPSATPVKSEPVSTTPTRITRQVGHSSSSNTLVQSSSFRMKRIKMKRIKRLTNATSL